MNPLDVKAGILSVLSSVAPELEPELLVQDRPLRRQIDLDSMDWLNFLVGLHQTFGVDIPEADYGRLVTLDDIERYLVARSGRCAS
ncbi:MAG TPA: acyl carrier protein [Methyloversatilis sp.]